MRLLHAAGFSASERESYRVIVFSNIFSIMQTLLEITQQLDLEIHDKDLQVQHHDIGNNDKSAQNTITIGRSTEFLPRNAAVG